MKCPYCGAELNIKIMKCEYCGSYVEHQRRKEIHIPNRKSILIKFLFGVAVIFISIPVITVLSGFLLLRVTSYDYATTEIVQDVSSEEEERLVSKISKNEDRNINESTLSSTTFEKRDILTQLNEQEIVLYAEEVEFIEGKTQQFNVRTYLICYQSDDCEVEAYISVPEQCFESESSYPCIVFNRGGNRDFSANTAESVSYYADSSNYIVVASQYRGTSGSTGQDEYGGEDVNDIIHLMDICEDLSIIDMDELYMMGVSRGGMMTYRTISQDDRIKRAVVISGVADLFLSYENRDDMKILLDELLGGSPAELPEEYEKRSATYWAENIKCPVLIIHSKLDERVSFKEAEKMVECLEKESKEYKFISYDDDVHGLHPEDFSVIMEWFGLQ